MKNEFRAWVARLFVELVVVFLGVYLAFVLNNYREKRQIDQERQKVLIGLLEGFREIRGALPGNLAFHKNLQSEVDSVIREGVIPSQLSYWRFLQPQYNLSLIDYALQLKGEDIIDRELYLHLSGTLVNAKKLMYTEEKLTQLSLDYEDYIAGSSLLSNAEINRRKVDNFQRAKRFNKFLEDHVQVLSRIIENSDETIALIEQRIDS